MKFIPCIKNILKIDAGTAASKPSLLKWFVVILNIIQSV